MTSFMIQAHEGRQIPTSWKSDPDCIFCRIIKGETPAFRVYEDDKVIAILDILPLRTGHTLVIPKIHCSRVSELPIEFAAAGGIAVTKVSHALAEALDNTALNVVCNQEYAQAVPHVHYHIIPAPSHTTGSHLASTLSKSDKSDRRTRPLTEKEMHQREWEARNELDDEEATSLVQKIRARL
ncbi:HIT-like protein [Obba rivulosa]|uniref:HIT-like protein n=1 Tax=Obba rivulosa TaxID=1052685 RepID=A0A8E2B1C8_9APHY|nr:HIT-like protein [Obba rivulosa]